MNDISLGALQISTEVEVIEAKENWSEYRLADGTILRIKPVMIAITRIEGEVSEGGDPVYNMKSTLVTDVRAASGLAAE